MGEFKDGDEVEKLAAQQYTCHSDMTMLVQKQGWDSVVVFADKFRMMLW